MSQRLAARYGLVPQAERAPDATDLVRVNEPTVGAPVRTKGSLYLLAQLTDPTSGTIRAARETLEAIEHEYYYDMSAGPQDTLARALAQANRRLFHGRGRAGLTKGAQLSIVGAVDPDRGAARGQDRPGRGDHRARRPDLRAPAATSRPRGRLRPGAAGGHVPRGGARGRARDLVR